uniref:Membrane insertase YidC/Oxa/ALB C-terminal domain-containing protein n=1 Tax=Strigamia maritima TaxID=126957 RepID=T1IW89_STRMM
MKLLTLRPMFKTISTRSLTHLRVINTEYETTDRNLSSKRAISTQFQWAAQISRSDPVLTCQSYIETVHNTLHLPWWATIVICTVGLRTLITFPVSIYQRYIIAKIQNVHLQIPPLVDELKKETARAAKMYNWSEKYSSLKKVIKELIVTENCHPFKSILVVLIQMPLWVCVSFALRNMVYMLPEKNAVAQLLHDELSVGGALWFCNLTVPDPFWVLPVMLGVFNLAIVEVHALNQVKITRFHRLITNIMRGMSVFMVFFAANVPSGMALYWTTSSLVGLIQNVALQSPSFRHFCRIPKTPTDTEKPFQQLLKRIKSKILIQDFESNQDPVRHKSSRKRMREKLLRKLPEKHHSMQCPKICDEMIYTDRLKMIEGTPNDPGWIQQAISLGYVTSLTFYFDDVIEEIEELYKYSFVSFISDVGGNLGLFLGLSIPGLFQLAES